MSEELDNVYDFDRYEEVREWWFRISDKERSWEIFYRLRKIEKAMAKANQCNERK